MSCATGAPDDDRQKVEVIKSDAQDVSPALSDLAKVPVPEVIGLRAREAEPWRAIPHAQLQSLSQQRDPVVQDAIGSANIPSTIVTFEGMGSGLAGFTVQSAPPDTDGDVGPNHYVQIVNSGVTVFSRTGAKLLGPINTNTLFNGFAGACATTNDGDGIVRYDRMADRWVISQFSVNGGNGPFFQCVAVSTTPDPTGTYNRYSFTFDGFNDYPKIGLWPDGYYFTYNMFPNDTFAGSRVCAADRAKMLAGAAATQQCFNTTADIGGLLASDLDGPTQPPAGSPNFLMALDTNTTLAFFKMHVDFTTPANSTFTGPTQITVAPFTPLCNGGTCVVQPGTTNRLDSLADRLMNRLVYRQFADHESLLVSHAVTAGTGGGIRFYELRTPNTTPTVFQQGTYAPDNAFRWMSSLTFDQAGNIGLGFATSSSTINPSVRYTGRLASDALGTMGQGEATLVAGTGSQTGGLTRWGDYSSMNIDPTDDCTFWYTQEYEGASGSFNWRTRVGTFKFGNCGAVTNDFSITPNPTSQTVAAGSSTTYTVNTAVISGAAENIALSVTGLPGGASGTFDPTSVGAGGSSTLTVTVAAGTPASTTQFTITGTGASATHTASASLIITNNNVPPTVSITSPTAGSTVSGTINVAATAADTDGTVASVAFTMPDGSTVTDTTAPFATTFDTTKVPDGAGKVFKAVATDDRGATATSSVTVTVANNTGGQCINGAFTSTDVPKAIPDNNATGVTSVLPVTGNGTVASLSLSLNISHTFRGDLVVTLISPGGTQFVVSNRAGGSADNIVITNQAITAFSGQTAAGTWQLKVADVASVDVGTINSWSLNIVGNCTPVVHWSGMATPNLPTIDNGTACTSLTVTATGGSASVAKLDISGSHAFRSILRGTLAHNGTTVTAFPTGTFPTGSGAFAFTNRAVPGFSGDASGTWTLCIVDTDAFGDTGVLNTWAVHD
ncbi:MAG TPA: proprotein convertase P-domain-containing protein [Kofleriaceae bacterium]|nr:proprotein convertase P-domain-containing protein [Kofleriaceae bacterium]